MTATDVVAVLAALEAAGVSVVLNGGWGVDALLGEQTREHDDLDVHVSTYDVERLCHVLLELGFVECRADGRAENFVLRAADDRRVDVHALPPDDVGGGVYRLEDGSDWIWPPWSFSGTGTIAGRTVACLSPEGQLLEHTGYELDETDRRDVELVRARFGVELRKP